MQDLRFPSQGWTPCPLQWKGKSSALDHQGSPRAFYCMQTTLGLVAANIYKIFLHPLFLWHFPNDNSSPTFINLNIAVQKNYLFASTYVFIPLLICISLDSWGFIPESSPVLWLTFWCQQFSSWAMKCSIGWTGVFCRQDFLSVPFPSGTP